MGAFAQEESFVPDEVLRELSRLRAEASQVQSQPVLTAEQVMARWGSPLEENLGELARILAVLGDKIKLEIVVLLRLGEASAGTIGLALEMPKSSLSHHLKALERAGMIAAERQGQRQVYALTTPARELLDVLERYVVARSGAGAGATTPSWRPE